MGRVGWKEREGERERGFGEFFFHSSTFQTLNSFKTFQDSNYFPKLSNQFKNF
jgi:hypothetical protein